MISNLGNKFLAASLSQDGARALKKAIQRQPVLADVLIPRAILSWLEFTTEHEYEGEIPGIDNSYVQFQKNEEGFSGIVSMGEGVYSFEKSSVYHLAAAIAASLDVNVVEVSPDLRDTVLVKLGKSIDVLTKAQALVKELNLRKKILDPNSGYTMHHESVDSGNRRTGQSIRNHTVSAKDAAGNVIGRATFTEHQGSLNPVNVFVDDAHQRKGVGSAMYAHAEKKSGMKVIPSQSQTNEGAALWAGNSQNKQFGKTELPGQTHKPAKQDGPIPPSPPTKQPANAVPSATIPKKPKLPFLSINKSEAEAPCDMCGGKNFANNKFKGCICWSDLSKSIDTVAYGDGYVLNFKPSIDRMAMKALIKFFRR